MTTLADITRHRIVPVVVVNDAASAAGLADALVAGGLPVAEITLRTPAGLTAIEAMSGRTDLLVGAGTVRSVAQLEAAVDAGARFVVSPGFSAAIVQRAQQLAVPILPGCVTPSEIMAAQELGVEAVKFFPASVYGGAAALKALSAPFNDLQFVPTGGVNEANLSDYLRLPCVPAVGGSWMVPSVAIDAGRFDEVAQLTRQAMQKVAEL